MSKYTQQATSTLWCVLVDDATGYTEIMPECDLGDLKPSDGLKVVKHGLSSLRQAERVRVRVEDQLIRQIEQDVIDYNMIEW